MPVRTDPLRDFNRLARQRLGTRAPPATMPMDAWREDQQIVVQFDLPGVDLYSVDLDVPRNLLTVRAERGPSTDDDADVIAAERQRGVLRRQVVVGVAVDIDQVRASYTAGVLTLHILLADKTKPHTIAVTNADADVGRGELTG
jgi:HSP20 family protein